MKVINVEQRSEAWHEAKLGMITGKGLKRVVGTPRVRDEYFYVVLAQRLSTEANPDESAMDRGVRLEDEAIAEYEKRTGLKVEKLGLTVHDDNKWIGNSPDGYIKKGNIYVKPVEVKCLSSANHIKAYLTKEVPEEHKPQGIQYFIVNPVAEELDFVFYDPRISKIPFFIITLKRKDLEKEINEAKAKLDEFINDINNALDKII